MQVIIINKHYMAWGFKDIKAAKPFIAKDKRKDYFIKKVEGQKVRIYCPYNCWNCKNINCKYRRN